MTGLTGRRVMVVEDIFCLAMEIKSVLEGAGAEVIGPFASGDKAFRSLGYRIPDCALLDVNLGETASFDLARLLRVRGIPFVFYTGYDRDALPPEFADAERLEKPIEPARLLQAVAACCRCASTATSG